MVGQLLRHERIETTLPRAKELRRLADQVVTIGKEVSSPRQECLEDLQRASAVTEQPLICLQGDLHARRKAAKIVREDDMIHKLFTTMAQRYKDRAGGYTRVLHTGHRPQDTAKMAVIE